MTKVLSRLFDSIWYRGHPLQWLLWPFGLLYRAAVLMRRSLYRHGVLQSVELERPVIVVGNVTVGGTGKTPCVVWLAERLRERGYRPGIVCRGHGGSAVQWPQPVKPDDDATVVGDESVLLARRTGCPVVAGPDRVAAVRLLLNRHAVDVVVSDDGLQHYRLGRAVEIAVVDGVRGLGNGFCLPAYSAPKRWRRRCVKLRRESRSQWRISRDGTCMLLRVSGIPGAFSKCSRSTGWSSSRILCPITRP